MCQEEQQWPFVTEGYVSYVGDRWAILVAALSFDVDVVMESLMMIIIALVIVALAVVVSGLDLV